MKTFIAAACLTIAVSAAASLSVPQGAAASPYASSRFYPEEAILDWSGERFTIIRIDSLDIHSEERIRLESWIEGDPDRIDALQNTVMENGDFARALRARSVQLNNVVAVQQALNGNLVVYLR
jgi:hypothetical protein